MAFATVCLSSIPVAFVAAWRCARRMLRSLDRFDSQVLPHFAPSEPGEIDQSLPARMERVAQEMSFNHGHSVKDVLRRVDVNVADHGRRLTALESPHTHEGP